MRPKCDTFVVLDAVRVPRSVFTDPLVELRDGIETNLFVALGRLDDRRNENLEEWEPDQRWPVVVDEVHDQAFDVRPVLQENTN